MPAYKAPLRDMRFLFHEVFAVPELYDRIGKTDASPDVIDALFAEAAKFAENELAPINQAGDEHGSHWEDGAVITPPGWKEAWNGYAEGQWGSMGSNPKYGGQGLPDSLELAINELLNQGAMAWRACGGLTLG